jgi:hypothetical protein
MYVHAARDAWDETLNKHANLQRMLAGAGLVAYDCIMHWVGLQHEGGGLCGMLLYCQRLEYIYRPAAAMGCLAKS